MRSDTVSTFDVCSSNGGSKTSPALCQWSEVMNHPGLVCCVQQTTGVPLVVMVKPDTFLIQEIKTLPAKAKVSVNSLPRVPNLRIWAISGSWKRGFHLCVVAQVHNSSPGEAEAGG